MLNGINELIVLLYGSGLRVIEAVRLRIQDIDFNMHALTVRSDRGNKDRVTTFFAKLRPILEHHLCKVREIHQQDLVQGVSEVYLPHALAKKSPGAAKQWG